MHSVIWLFQHSNYAFYFLYIGYGELNTYTTVLVNLLSFKQSLYRIQICYHLLLTRMHYHDALSLSGF